MLVRICGSMKSEEVINVIRRLTDQQTPKDPGWSGSFDISPLMRMSYVQHCIFTLYPTGFTTDLFNIDSAYLKYEFRPKYVQSYPVQ